MTPANNPVLAVGLISGTSMDGIDAALVRVGGDVAGGLEVVAFRSVPYMDDLARTLRSAVVGTDATEVALLDAAVGEAFADAALEVLVEAGVTALEVDCIGSHGQTLMHVAEPRVCAGYAVRASLQIGCAGVIAERTGITTVSDFRSRDIAAGGQGAPLVPFLDHRLYADADRGRVALNIGGIANITALPAGAGLSDITAFDTGPGNVLLDAVARHRGIGTGFDDGGAIAAAGEVDEALLAELLRNPFYDAAPPKSADTVDVLDEAVRTRLESSTLSDADLLATLCELTARTIAEAIERHVAPGQAVDEIVVSGGGVHNRTLMGRFEAHMASVPVVDCAVVAPGVSAEAKEAVLFAVLAHETLGGRPGNVPSATGAAGPRVLGVVAPGV